MKRITGIYIFLQHKLGYLFMGKIAQPKPGSNEARKDKTNLKNTQALSTAPKFERTTQLCDCGYDRKSKPT